MFLNPENADLPLAGATGVVYVRFLCCAGPHGSCYHVRGHVEEEGGDDATNVEYLK